MQASIEIGQSWSIWVPGRRQWLLGKVIRRVDGRATLKYDPGYRIGTPHDEALADESTMLTAPNLFRIVESD
jgi:hypothetical protein